MKLRLFREETGIIQSFIFVEEEKEVRDIDELKSCMKKAFSAMKKKSGYSGVSFQICADAGYYMVVNRYIADAETFETTYCQAWNVKDEPTMKSQKNIMCWAVDVFKCESYEKELA